MERMFDNLITGYIVINVRLIVEGIVGFDREFGISKNRLRDRRICSRCSYKYFKTKR